MPIYLVYRVNSMGGTAHTDYDCPAELSLLGSCQAVNGYAAREEFAAELGNSPAVVLRENTVHYHALKSKIINERVSEIR